jgi:hypothetical protein
VANESFLRSSGYALALGGALTFLINALLTPFLPKGVPFSTVAASPIFLWRQSASALAAMLLLFGAVGLYLRQSNGASRFGAAVFAMAFVGSALLVAMEWNQIFDTRDLAVRAPATLNALDSSRGLSLTDLGAMIVICMFTAGWIAFAGWTLRMGIFPRRAAGLVIAGFFLIPLLHAVLPGSSGDILGNGVLGTGWFWLGIHLFRPWR